MEVELEELNNAEDEVKLGFKELKETIIKAEPLKGKARLDLIEDCHRLLKRIERSLKLYSLGIRSLDTDDVTEYKETLQKFNTALAKYKRKVEEIELNELTEKKSKTITKSEHKLYTYSLFDISPESAFDMNEDEMLEEADRMQKDDIDMLVDAINTTNETKSIGMETIEKLDRQNEQLDNAIDDTRKIQEDLKIAAREMRIITTKITTDKLISIGIIILTVAAVAIVVVMIVLPKGKEIVETFT